MAISPSSSSFSPIPTYDVFINFRGMDQKHVIVTQLPDALHRQKIEARFLDGDLEGESCPPPELVTGIQESKLSVFFLSGLLASSSWCTRELHHILEWQRNTGQSAVPKFYLLNPSYVWEEETCAAFSTLEESFKDQMDKVQIWRQSLMKAPDLDELGSNQAEMSGIKLIETIVEDILKSLNKVSIANLDSLVGLEKRTKDIEMLLDIISSTNTCTLGIYGESGIGKTTLAKVVYNQLSSRFEDSFFFANVREESEKQGLACLLSKLSALFEKEVISKSGTPSLGSIFVKERLPSKRVLVVLDDVNYAEQFKELAREHNFFSLGSRIIVTTRDVQVLNDIGVDEAYHVEPLTDHEALQLFHMNAFRNNYPTTDDHVELSEWVVRCAKGIPLVLEVLGSYIFFASKSDWTLITAKLKSFHDQVEILDLLGICYENGLDYEEKNIFLEIVCFFKDMEKDFVEKTLEHYGYSNANARVDGLSARSLITINHYGQICMHDLVQQMGVGIISQQSNQELGKRNWSWTSRVNDFSRYDAQLAKFTEIHCTSYWPVVHLTDLKLDRTTIKEIPSSITNLIGLERLSLKMCENLELLPSSISNLNHLKELNICCCQKLKSLPKLPLNLEILNAKGCMSLEMVSRSRIALMQVRDKCLQIYRGRFDFMNCVKLEQKARINIMDDAQFRMWHMATSLSTEEEGQHGGMLEFWCPGNEIPEGFIFQSAKSSIKIPLPTNWQCNDFLGFALCAVVDFEDCYIDNKFEFSFKFDLSVVFPASFKMVGWSFPWRYDPDGGDRIVNSDHLFYYYEKNMFGAAAYENVVEASVFFYSNKRDCKVKRCGVRLLYAEDLPNMSNVVTQGVGESSDIKENENVVKNVVAPTSYDVFISFLGEDTRNNFAAHLYYALCKKSITAYMSDGSLEQGEEISPTTLRAIEESRISVIIFSENYASSSCCLDELNHILQCYQTNGQIFVPVFYHVAPSHFGDQLVNYGLAFDKHKHRFKDRMEKVHRWRNALETVVNFPRYYEFDRSNLRPESELIEKICRDLGVKLGTIFSCDDFKQLVGIDKRIMHVEALLNINSSDVHIVCIWGIRGIGKTTLATVIFSRIANQFDGCCFLNVREESQKCGLIELKIKIFCVLLEEEKRLEWLSKDGKQRLRRKKVLIVLDDVDNAEQLKYLAGDRSWLGTDSKIIVTTRDVQLLKYADRTYEVEELDNYEAHQLFSLQAFGKNYLPTDFLELSKGIVKFTKGIPLHLVVLGSQLRFMSIKVWESELKKLEANESQYLDNITKHRYR